MVHVDANATAPVTPVRAGIPAALANIAVCDVCPPHSSTRPCRLLLLRAIKSPGVKADATRITGESAALGGTIVSSPYM
jgi:hypothetical protein